MLSQSRRAPIPSFRHNPLRIPSKWITRARFHWPGWILCPPNLSCSTKEAALTAYNLSFYTIAIFPSTVLSRYITQPQQCSAYSNQDCRRTWYFQQIWNVSSKHVIHSTLWQTLLTLIAGISSTKRMRLEILAIRVHISTTSWQRVTDAIISSEKLWTVSVLLILLS